MLDNYYDMLAEERTKQRNDKANMELVKDYLKDCRKKERDFSNNRCCDKVARLGYEWKGWGPVL